MTELEQQASIDHPDLEPFRPCSDPTHLHNLPHQLPTVKCWNEMLRRLILLLSYYIPDCGSTAIEQALTNPTPVDSAEPWEEVVAITVALTTYVIHKGLHLGIIADVPQLLQVLTDLVTQHSSADASSVCHLVSIVFPCWRRTLDTMCPGRFQSQRIAPPQLLDPTSQGLRTAPPGIGTMSSRLPLPTHASSTTSMPPTAAMHSGRAHTDTETSSKRITYQTLERIKLVVGASPTEIRDRQETVCRLFSPATRLAALEKYHNVY